MNQNTSRMSREGLRIESAERPGWWPSEGRIPDVGDYVFCLEGPAKVVRLLGRTSDGSRLLELEFEDRRHPFFASSSNVLMRTVSPDLDATPDSSGTEPSV